MAKGQRRAKNVPPPPSPPPVALAVAVSAPSPSTSDSSSAEIASNTSDMHAEGSYGVSGSRPGSPMQLHLGADGLDTEDVVTCQWEDCGVVFTHLPTLISHIHNDHIGVHKSNYTCEWASCLRRGLPQTSRFALISHIRSHTGEKPFICPLPECDKSFTRSDALAKHVRLQHNISPPAPGRGGSRKRKRGAVDDQTQGTSTPVASAVVSPLPWTISNASGLNSFKVEPQTPSEAVDEAATEPHDYFSGTRIKTGTNGRQRRQPQRQSQLHAQHTPPLEEVGHHAEEDDGYDSSASDVLPRRLQSHFDEGSGLVMGRTPAKVMYLLMKAKQRYALEQHDILMDELRAIKTEMQKEKHEKEDALDDLLHRMLGSHAEVLMALPAPIDEFASDLIPGLLSGSTMNITQNGTRSRRN